MKVIDEQYRPVAVFFLSSAFWFFLATIGGLFLAAAMVAPDLPLYKNVSWLVFGRLRPVHTNMMIFGFVGSALLGSMYFAVPRLARTSLYSHRIARISVWTWNMAIAAGTITLALGLTQGREYA
jgi:cbb3-type cytochrome oxidase subunit 1